MPGLNQNKCWGTPQKGLLIIEVGNISSIIDEVGADKHESFMSSLHMKWPSYNISVNQYNTSALKYWYVAKLLIQVDYGTVSLILFPSTNTLLRNFLLWLRVFQMAPFFNMLFISTCTFCLWARFMCGAFGILAWIGFLWKYILYTSTSCRISESFVSTFHVCERCFSVPVNRNFETFLSENKFYQYALSMNGRSLIC